MMSIDCMKKLSTQPPLKFSLKISVATDDLQVVLLVSGPQASASGSGSSAVPRETMASGSSPASGSMEVGLDSVILPSKSQWEYSQDFVFRIS